MARNVDDIMSRRTRARLVARDASAEAAERVGQLLMKELDLPATEIDAQVASYKNQTAHERAILMGEN